MPNYDFICKKCNYEFEEYLSFDDDRSKLKCPKCKSKKVERNFGSVQMGIAKGSGSSSAECNTCSSSSCSTT
jgi:putative FmdB family regulatory protein